MLYARASGGDLIEPESGGAWEGWPEHADFERALARTDKVMEKLDEIDGVLARYSKDWRLGRLSRVDLSIMRLALYEMQWGGTPPPVAINEAVELAKRYGADESRGFVNGILSAWLRDNLSETVDDTPSDNS